MIAGTSRSVRHAAVETLLVASIAFGLASAADADLVGPRFTRDEPPAVLHRALTL